MSSTPWNWNYVCPTGLKPWIEKSNQLAPCFQQIFLEIPMLAVFSLLSAYHFGSLSGEIYRRRQIVRNSRQKYLMVLRIFATATIGIYPFFKYWYMVAHEMHIWPIDILKGGIEIITFLVHFGWLLGLKRYGSLDHRGPLALLVIWIMLALLSIVWVTTDVEINIWPWSFIIPGMHLLYGVSLIFKGSAVFRLPVSGNNAGGGGGGTATAEDDERQALLGRSYIRFQDDVDELALGHGPDNTNILSKLSFYWVNPLIKKGLTGHLRRIDDLFMLPNALNVTRITENLHIVLMTSKSMIKALHQCHGVEFYSIGFLRLIADLSGFAGPLLLGGLLSISNDSGLNDDDDDNFDAKPYYYALGLFATTLLSAFCGTHFNWRMAIITMKMRIGLVTAIYTKSLEVHSLDDTSPDILNLMSTDTDRIVNSCISFHSFWSIPFQLIVTLYLLYAQIGVAFVAGVIFAAALIPLNRWIAKKIGLYSERLMWAKDARISVSSEALTNAKHIKLLAWEDIFKKKILGYRKNELVYLSKRKYLDALCVYFWATTPILMCLLTFSVSVLMGNSLTPATTFTTVALLNMLIGPLNTFPWVLNGLIEAWVSVKRVQQLMDLPNIDVTKYHTIPGSAAADSKYVIKLTNTSFKFDHGRRLGTDSSIDGNNIDGNANLCLDNISLTIEKGDLVCLEGPVGGGKSSLLLAILAELSTTDNNGQIWINHQNEGFGYVGQSTWLQRGTIRENILWGESFDENRYMKVIMACALGEDIIQLGGDRVGVGEGGRTLSGGQQVRVALARAVYQDKPIYLLDDILSSLDANVANHIVKHCILGILKEKTCIIVTENRSLYYCANQILHVSSGRVSVSDIGVDGFSEEELFENGNDGENSNSIKKDDNQLNLVGGIDDKEDERNDNISRDSVMMDETKEYGTLASNVFQCYWKATGRFLGIMVLLSVILMQLTRNLSDVWLAHWVSQNNTTITPSNLSSPLNSSSSADTNFYLGTYAGIAILNSFITLGRAFLFAYAGIKAAKFIHQLLLNCVFGAKFQFFDITPLGRILNRFSSDTYTIDDSLPFILNILLAQLAGLIGSIVISLYAMPWLSLLIVPLFPVYFNIQKRYRCSSRDIKRLSSNALSPLYAHFTETLQGLITIRAMCGTKRFHRDFLVKLEESVRAQLTASAAQQWLAIRLQLLGATLVGGAGLVAAITSAHQSSPGMVGLAISYALSVTGLLGGVLSALAETEQELISIERVDQYCKLETEHNADGVVDSPPFGWPCQGVVSFKDTFMKYRENLALSLLDINFETAPCERVGIVGRTGAGKSSILSALMRVAPINHGTIKIDCVDVNTLPLTVLRSRIAIVPQHPFLFSGTIRENLDPHGLHIDSKIWQSINQCLAAPLVQSLGGLDGFVESNGGNLSAGQKQLLCLARALLKNAKIVCIDEGTANLDSDSEVSIQLVLRNSFKSSTVFVIAHRIQSLQHTDRILVMDGGRIVEQGIPSALSVDKSTIFYQMLQDQRIRHFSGLGGNSSGGGGGPSTDADKLL